jgi:hypothetical protein
VDKERPRTLGEWEKLTTELGMRRKDRDSPWSMATAAGEVRAFAFFLEDTTSFWVLFFTASLEPIPDAVLSHLLKDAPYTSVDADKLEIGLGPVEQLPGGGTKVKHISVSIAGGRLLTTRTMIEWK